jgi:hypothetical protein
MTFLPLVLVLIACVAMVALPPLHPAQLWAIVWALAVGAYALRLLPYANLGALAQLLIGGASLGFVGGTLIGERLGRRVLSHVGAQRQTPRETDPRLAAMIVLAATLLGLSGFLVQAVRAYGLRAALVSSPAVRLAVRTGTFHITIKYVYAAVAASALCGACAAIGPHRRRWALATGVAVFSTYFATGRATVVVATVTALSAYAWARPRLPSKRSFILGACIVIVIALGVFTLGGSLIGKTLNNSELASIDSALVRHPLLRPIALPYLYLSAPVAAFGLEASIADRLPHFYGCASFGYVCSILHHAGLHVPSFPEVRPFTAAPLAWNTYTSLDAPLLDGGVWMVIPAAVLAGIFLGALWLAARERKLLALLGYAILVSSIVTAAGSNNFTASYLLGAIIIVIGAVLGAQLINRTPRYRRGA